MVALDNLAEPLRSALTTILTAYLGFDEATTSAYANTDQSKIAALANALQTGAPPADATSADIKRRSSDGRIGPVAGANQSAALPLQSLGIDLGPVIGARNALLDAVVGLRDAMSMSSQSNSGVGPLDLCPVVAIHLDVTDDYYYQDCFLTIDAGGNDYYSNNAGGNGIGIPWYYTCPVLANLFAAAALVDLGGNDNYNGYWRNCGQGGGGYLGSGFLVDAGSGDSDVYSYGSYGTTGGGYLGTGFLLDAGGYSNQVTGHDWGTNGGGAEGDGFLLDGAAATNHYGGNYGTNGGGYLGAGTDISTGTLYSGFWAGYWATNGGGCEGSGFLVNLGDDYGGGFSAPGGGTNGGAWGGYCNYNYGALTTGGSGLLVAGDHGNQGVSGDNGSGWDIGVGMLIGGAGVQNYSGGNGSGGDLGSGFLLDPGGDDYYYGWGNGGGWYEGTGFLLDLAGNDSYGASYYGFNGGGWEAGVGFLLDAAGNDVYNGDGYGTNGGGAYEGVGFLHDIAGDDTYTATTCGVNGGACNTASGSLLDDAGNDSYSDSDGGTGQNKTVVPKGTAGSQIDATSNRPPGVPILLVPSAGGTVRAAAAQLFTVRAVDPDADAYAAVVTVTQGSSPVATFATAPSASGAESTGTPGLPLAPGNYSWSAHAVDAKGTSGPESAGQAFTVAPPGTGVGEIAFTGSAVLPVFPCSPPAPFGTGPCSGSFSGDWSAHLAGTSGTSSFDTTWATTTGAAVSATFQYAEWQCLQGAETLAGFAIGSGSATAAPGTVQGKWQVPGETFPRDITGATFTFQFSWTRALSGAVLTLNPVSLTLDVAGLGTQVVVTGTQTGTATLVVRSTDNTSAPTCSTPLTNVRGEIAGTVQLIS